LYIFLEPENFQTCFVHKLGALKSIQFTILLITKNLKLLFNWFLLQWFCFYWNLSSKHLFCNILTQHKLCEIKKPFACMHTCLWLPHVELCFYGCVIALFRLWRGAELPLWVMWVCWLLPR
jgi:hypothetical protein